MMVFFYWGVVWYVYTAGIVFFIFCVMLSISRQIKQQNQQHEVAKLRSARLETELLKKHIQPHFLMNTLLSIISWIREDPPTAIKLIQSLAEEFRMINQISSQTEIPLSDEVALCRTHLTLMGYRQDVQYALEAQNLPGEEKIPPMIFHTLIENGLTHAYRSGENG
ncbi:MAG: histidine kinase, partial [Calditrichaeota bacterium]|nr:histidine kinase [Calditrichota bacterium]